jgi:aminopeptidase N
LLSYFFNSSVGKTAHRKRSFPQGQLPGIITPLNYDLTLRIDASENNESYIFNQFEVIDARKAFPSFDEPRFKVPFVRVLEIRNDYKRLAHTTQEVLVQSS